MAAPEQRRVDIAELRAAATIDRRNGGGAGRRGRVLGLGSALVAAVVAGLVWSAMPPSDHSPEVARPRTDGQDLVAWAPVLRELDGRRSKAFETGDGTRLLEVYASGSAALTQELDRLAVLAQAGVTARRLRTEVVEVRLLDTAPGRADLLVRDRLLPYDLASDDGTVLEQRPGRDEREWIVTVVPAPGSTGEWRIQAIEPTSR